VDSQHETSSWKTSEGEVTLELRGDRVLIVEGLPDKVDRAAIIKSLWVETAAK
jgi:hypothetical protein